MHAHTHTLAASLALLALLTGRAAAEPDAAGVHLVRDHRPASVIIVNRRADPFYRRLADSFAATVERSTGARLPVLTEGEETALPADATRLYIGPTDRAKALGLSPQDLAEETYRIVAKGNTVIVAGRDARRPDDDPAWRKWRNSVDVEPTRWALNHILETGIGVRWLWPGELGTYVPKRADLAVAAAGATYQPALFIRSLRLGGAYPPADTPLRARLAAEAYDWLANHQGNRGRTGNPRPPIVSPPTRADIPYNHAFNHWYETYGKDHPDWFVTPPPGKQLPAKPFWVKMRFTNPEVIEQIAKEYVEAGAPKYWDVSEGDGEGFDISPEIRKWDIPAGQSIEDIWHGRGQLTARYVKIWNTIYDRLKKINPDVTLVAMAYSSYREPPPPQRPLTARMIITQVVSYRAYDGWTQWRRMSEDGKMILRPNWGWIAANAPHLPLKQIHDYMQFASRNGMVGFSMDSIIGFWGTQGPNYYWMARMMTRPDLSNEDLLNEFSSAFGAGAPQIKEYLNYWQALADKYGYTSSGDTPGGSHYAQLVQQDKIPASFVAGPRLALKYLYDPSALRPAYRLLDQAAQRIAAAAPVDQEALRRVEFLRGGLDEMSAFRDLYALGWETRKAPTKPSVKKLAAMSRALDALRQSLYSTHAVWEAVDVMETKRKLPIRPENLSLPSDLKHDEDFDAGGARK